MPSISNTTSSDHGAPSSFNSGRTTPPPPSGSSRPLTSNSWAGLSLYFDINGDRDVEFVVGQDTQRFRAHKVFLNGRAKPLADKVRAEGRLVKGQALTRLHLPSVESKVFQCFIDVSQSLN